MEEAETFDRMQLSVSVHELPFAEQTKKQRKAKQIGISANRRT